jgi:hypothetical protein
VSHGLSGTEPRYDHRGSLLDGNWTYKSVSLLSVKERDDGDATARVTHTALG